MKERVTHTFEPLYDKDSRVLIVGSMPSVLSRRDGFYYGNPQNRFYRVIAALTGGEVPEDIAAKKALLLGHGIALYDVLEQCEIEGSADASIKDARPNDFSSIFQRADIRGVFANGKTAHKYYTRFVGEADCLPSTSPANAAWSLARLVEAWSVITGYLGNTAQRQTHHNHGSFRVKHRPKYSK